MTQRDRQSSIPAFEARIAYTFDNGDLLQEALTHAGAGSAHGPHNERLEFLGDRVLGLVVADTLLRLYPTFDEGGLARALNALVRKEACVVVAKQVGLGAMLHMDNAEERSGGREKKGVLGDACEALIAALYLDGGFAAAEAFIVREWAAQFESAGKIRSDAKTTLQEWAHAVHTQTPTYEVIERMGPDHAPSFTVRVNLEGIKSMTGVGRSKRDAEQNAAARLLEREGMVQ